jgi:hypothetical protein
LPGNNSLAGEIKTPPWSLLSKKILAEKIFLGIN